MTVLHELIRTAGNPYLKLANDLINVSNKAKESLDLFNSIAVTDGGLSKELKAAKRTLTEFQQLDLQFVKSFIPDKLILNKLPGYFIDTILLYAIGNRQANRKVQESDTGDLMHAFYLSYCDIWRGDKKFCNLLIEQKVDGHQKAVKLLTELPSVIESKLIW